MQKDKKKNGRPKKYTDDKLKELGESLIAFMSNPNHLWLKEFCIENGFSSQRLSEFAKNNEDFSESLKRAKDIQEVNLLKNAMKNPQTSTLTIFALKNVAGWRSEDKSEEQTEHKPIKIEIVNN